MHMTVRTTALLETTLAKFSNNFWFTKSTGLSSDWILLYLCKHHTLSYISHHCLRFSPPLFPVVLYYPNSLHLPSFLDLFHWLFFPHYLAFCPVKSPLLSLSTFSHEDLSHLDDLKYLFNYKSFRIVLFLIQAFVLVFKFVFQNACKEMPSPCSMAS